MAKIVTFSVGDPPRKGGGSGVCANILEPLYARLDECVANVAR